MLSGENIRLPWSCQSSSCSSSTAPTRRVIEASFGKMPTTRVRRFTSSFNRSSRLVLHTFFQWRFQHQLGGLGEPLIQGGRQVIPALHQSSGVLLAEHRAQGRCDHSLVGFWDSLQQVSGVGEAFREAVMNPAALLAAALEHAADGLGQAHVGITDHELDASETSLLEGSNEGFPETLAFAVTNL